MQRDVSDFTITPLPWGRPRIPTMSSKEASDESTGVIAAYGFTGTLPPKALDRLRSPLLPEVNRGSPFALRRPHSRSLSRWALFEGPPKRALRGRSAKTEKQREPAVTLTPGQRWDALVTCVASMGPTS